MKPDRTYHLIFCLLLIGASTLVSAQKKLYTDVLVIGGGTGGTAAGLQSARMSVSTIIAEPTIWLGGMLSSAGISAFDGNHNMPSGIWAEFRNQLYKVYGGPSKVATGWVSNTLFEPHIADSILKSMANRLPRLKIFYKHRFVRVIMNGRRVEGAVFLNDASTTTVTILAKQVIDATELGDVMAAAGIPFDIGMEAAAKTGENVNISQDNTIIQDLTYAAILKDYGSLADCTLVRPANYDPREFDCCCNQFCSDSTKLISNVDAKKMLDYGKLPHNKYMINWPGKGNDIYLNLIFMNADQRETELQKAKDKTIRFIYFLQTQFGFKHISLADDEFPTADRLPLIPYNREGRRVKGIVRFKIQDLADPFNQTYSLYRTGISVGDYPIDHHHRENTDAPQNPGFYPVPSYNVPLGTLIPKEYDGLILSEKGISVSNVVNGTTRLQPCVMLTGQAAGVLAALAVKQKKQVRNISIREVQLSLLRAGAYIMPYFDVNTDHPQFMAIQKIGATGILKGKGEPFKWANRTWFYPDSTVSGPDFISSITPFLKVISAVSRELTIGEALAIIKKNYKSRNAAFISTEKNWEFMGLMQFDMDRKITRAELAVLLDKTIKPFHKKINHLGNL